MISRRWPNPDPNCDVRDFCALTIAKVKLIRDLLLAEAAWNATVATSRIGDDIQSWLHPTEGGLALACFQVSVRALRVTAVDLPDNKAGSTRGRSESLEKDGDRGCSYR